LVNEEVAKRAFQMVARPEFFNAHDFDDEFAKE